MELELRVFWLPRAVEDGLAMIRPSAELRGVELATNVDPAVGPIEADERKLKQVLFNLLSNAVKFTPNGGRIELSARALEHEVLVSVTDTGVGISPADQERIFDEYQQLRLGSAETREGTG